MDVRLQHSKCFVPAAVSVVIQRCHAAHACWLLRRRRCGALQCQAVVAVLKSGKPGQEVGEVIVAFRGTEGNIKESPKVFVQDWATNLTSSTCMPHALTAREDHKVKTWQVIGTPFMFALHVGAWEFTGYMIAMEEVGHRWQSLTS
jgi:hypothetical protein